MTRLANYVRYLTALATQRGKYQVVLTTRTRSGATETWVGGKPTTERAAKQEYRWRMASGLFDDGSGRTARIMSVANARKAGIR